MDNRSLILGLEKELLKSEVRRSKEKIKELLSSNFKEYCSSGEVYKYKVGDTFYEEGISFEISDFSINILSDSCILSTYKLAKKDKRLDGETFSLRSSVWRESDGAWKMEFHQGTII